MDYLLEIIGTRLKNLRRQKAWSLDHASKKTGVSKAMLGQIERQESSPTIATLWKIASGFDVSFSSFVEGDDQDAKPLLLRQEKLHRLHVDDDKIRVMTLFPYDTNMGFEVFLIKLLPGCTHLSPPHQRGVTECVIPLGGMMEVYVSEKWHPVQAHEGFRFSAEVPHGYRNRTQEPILFHNIIHYAGPYTNLSDG